MSPARLLTGFSSMVLLVLGLVALLPDCASACFCGVLPGSEQEQARRALAQSSAVFAGEVVSITKGVPYGGGRTATFTVSFRVSEVWKGSESETLEVSTPRHGMSCGYRFSKGREYLVYASGRGVRVDACGETTLLSEASADLQALGNAETLGGGGVLSDTSGGLPPLGAIGTVALAVAAAGWVILMRLVRSS